MKPSLEEIETVELLKEPDFLFIDCNTWSIEVFNGKIQDIFHLLQFRNM